jgi:peptidyl-prolyl cis-trans isomerase SurA
MHPSPSRRSYARHAAAALFVVPLFCGVGPLAAQVPGITPGGGVETEELIDRVMAIAGDSIILLSQIQEQIAPLVAQDATLATDQSRLTALQSQVIQNLIDQSLVVQAAIQDTTIVVDEDRVEQIVDQDIAQRSEAIGGQAALMDGLREQGWSMQQYRELLKQDARRQQLQQQYMLKQQRGMKPIPVTADEIQTFYGENGAQFGQRPATVTFLQVVLQPQPNDSAEASALAETERILTLALAGDDFGELAKRNSGDPGSAELGGDLGWFRRGSGFVREFEEAAFSIQSGQITDPVRTQYGYHIIQVERVRGPERKARHILIPFDIAEQEIQDALDLAEELKSQIEGGADVQALHAEHGAEELPDSLSVAMDQLNELPPGYAAVLGITPAGSVFGPIQFGEGVRTNVTVGIVVDVRDEGTFTFEDLEPVIRDRLQREKTLEELMKRLRDRSYVEVRP